MGNSGNISDRHAVTRDMSIILAKHGSDNPKIFLDFWCSTATSASTRLTYSLATMIVFETINMETTDMRRPNLPSMASKFVAYHRSDEYRSICSSPNPQSLVIVHAYYIINTCRTMFQFKLLVAHFRFCCIPTWPSILGLFSQYCSFPRNLTEDIGVS